MRVGLSNENERERERDVRRRVRRSGDARQRERERERVGETFGKKALTKKGEIKKRGDWID